MSETNPLKRAADKVADALQGGPAGPEDGIPGKPGPKSPPVAEPTPARVNDSARFGEAIPTCKAE